jgi:hypothetical protein
VCFVAVLWLRRLLPDLSPRRPGFAPRPVHVEFVVDKGALGQVFLRVFSVLSCRYHSTVSLHTHTIGYYARWCPQFRDVVSSNRHEDLNNNNNNALLIRISTRYRSCSSLLFLVHDFTIYRIFSKQTGRTSVFGFS